MLALSVWEITSQNTTYSISYCRLVLCVRGKDLVIVAGFNHIAYIALTPAFDV